MKIFVFFVVFVVIRYLFPPQAVGWFALLIIMGIIAIPTFVPNKYFLPKKK